MSIKKTLIKNTGFNLLSYFYLLLASFFSISIILNNLGRDVFGVYIFMASFISIAAVFDFGISNAVVRKLALPQTTKEERIRTWKTSFAIFISLAFLLLVSVAAILMYLTGTMKIFATIDRNTLNLSILIISSIVFINHLNNHFLNLPQAEQRFDIFNSKTFLVGTANTVFSAIVSGLYHNIALIFLIQLVFHILTLVYMIFYSLKFFPGGNFTPYYDKTTGRDLFSFGIRNFIGTLAGQVEAQFSNFILGAMVSAQAITAFSIPQSIVAKGAGVVSQFAQAFFPLSASLLQKDRIQKLRLLVLGLEGMSFLGGLLAILFTIFIGQPFLLWWLKDPVVVQAAYPILKILSYYFMLISLTPIPTALIQGLGKPQIPSLFAVLTVALEISFALFLVPRFFAAGVAYSFLASASITVPSFLIVSWWQLQKEIKKTLSLGGIQTPTKNVSSI